MLNCFLTTVNDPARTIIKEEEPAAPVEKKPE
jgi:hypothetical protein